MNRVWFLARLFVGGVFAYSGLSKLLGPSENFDAIVNNYEIIPHLLVLPISRFLPWLEWLLGSLLVLGYAPRYVSRILAGLTFIFVLLLFHSFFTSTAGLDCGCFGEAGIHLTKKQVFILDTINFTLLIRLACMKNFYFSIDRFLKRKEEKKLPPSNQKRKKKKS